VSSVKKYSLLMGMAGLILPFGSVCHGAELVVDGGFESGTFVNWNHTGGFMCVGTSVCGGNNFDSGADPGPHSGNFAVYLGGAGSPGDVLSQTLTTVLGQTYTLDFFLAAPTDGGNSTPNVFTVLWGGNTVTTITDLTSNTYNQFTFSVIGSGSDLLEFDSSNNPAAFVLDDVSVQDAAVETVPEPGTMLLLGVGLAAVALLRRRGSTH
jgi:hypothetical protein